VSICCALGVLAFLVGAQTAVAGSPAVVQRTDPPAGSPAGVIYRIPLDSARRDAAPVLPAGSHRSDRGGGIAGGGGSGQGPAGGSGAPGGSGGGGAQGAPGSTHGGLAAARGTASGAGTPSEPSSIHSENGFGSSSQVPGVSPAAARMGAGVAAAHAGGSAFPSYLLVGVIALAAVAVGLVATRVKRSGPSSEDAKLPTPA
jgi:hypothetical protein